MDNPYSAALNKESECYVGHSLSQRYEIGIDSQRIESSQSHGISIRKKVGSTLEYRIIDIVDASMIDSAITQLPNYVLPSYDECQYNRTDCDTLNPGDNDFRKTDFDIQHYFVKIKSILDKKQLSLSKILIDYEQSEYKIYNSQQMKGWGRYSSFSPGVEVLNRRSGGQHLWYEVYDNYNLTSFERNLSQLVVPDEITDKKCILMLSPNALSSLVFTLLYYVCLINRSGVGLLNDIPVMANTVINSKKNNTLVGTVDGDGNFYEEVALLSETESAQAGIEKLLSQRWKVDYRAVPIARPHKITIAGGNYSLKDLYAGGSVGLVNDLKLDNNINPMTFDFMSLIAVNVCDTDGHVIALKQIPFNGNIISILKSVIKTSVVQKYGTSMILAPYALTEIHI